MPGKRATESATFVTPRAVYRDMLVAGGETDPTSTAIPVLDTRTGPHGNMALGQSDCNQYGQDARIFLFALMNGITEIVVSVWLKATVDQLELTDSDSSSSSSSAFPLPTTGEWVKITEATLTGCSYKLFSDIPPGQYKILVKTVTGSGEVRLLEQHAA